MNEVKVAAKKAEFAATGKFPAATKSLAILDKLVPQENVGKEREQNVKENKAVKAMQEAFSGYLKKDLFKLDIKGRYSTAGRQLKSREYTAGDVGTFSTSLVHFEEEKDFAERAGLFLSALMNRSRGKDFAIDIANLSIAIECLGYKNTKNVTVNGYAGDHVGDRMERGKITVNGDVGEDAGIKLKGGRILVKGNAGSSTGYDMSGGTIIVNGDASNMTGWCMRGGTIIVNGNIDSFGQSIEGGDIYQGERQLVKNGAKIDLPERV